MAINSELVLQNVEVFNYLIGMIMISFGNFGTGWITYSSLKVQLYYPIQGLVVVVKKISPFVASPLMGKFFFTTPAKPFLGKYNCTFRDS